MISWHPRLETGNAVVDNDHNSLIQQINALADALQNGTGRENLAQMLGFLNCYVRAHFVREEGIMRAVNCPASGQNCTAHKALIQKLDGWVARLQNGGATTSLVLEVHREASAWIQQHIVNVDCQLRHSKAA